MRVGIDISQIVFQGSGVAGYTKHLIENLLKIDEENEYVLFFSSLRRKFLISNFRKKTCSKQALKFLNTCPPKPAASGAGRREFQAPNPKLQIKTFKFPPTFLDLLWNRLHICPIEWFIGEVDVFFSSDWTQPPTIRAKKVTTLHDLSIFKFSKEHHPKIVAVQKRRLEWVRKECNLIICDSVATKEDAIEILGIEEGRLRVVYPGGTTVIPNLFRNLHRYDPEINLSWRQVRIQDDFKQYVNRH